MSALHGPVRILAERQFLGVAEVLQHITVGWGDTQGQQPDDTATHGGFLFRPALENPEGNGLAFIDDSRESGDCVTLDGSGHLTLHGAEVPRL